MRFFFVLFLLPACSDYGLTAFGDGVDGPPDSALPGDEDVEGDGLNPWETPWADPDEYSDWVINYYEPDDPNDTDTWDPDADDPDNWDDTGDDTVGRMTGGGTIESGGRDVHHGFTVHCAQTRHKNRLTLGFGGTTFHMEGAYFVACIDDPDLDPEYPVVGTDTVVGEGWGNLDGVPAELWFEMTDDGEPGTGDLLRFELRVGGVEVPGHGYLDGGNHQTHNPIPQ